MGALAEFERALISERTRAGIGGGAGAGRETWVAAEVGRGRGPRSPAFVVGWRGEPRGSRRGAGFFGTDAHAGCRAALIKTGFQRLAVPHEQRSVARPSRANFDDDGSQFSGFLTILKNTLDISLR